MKCFEVPGRKSCNETEFLGKAYPIKSYVFLLWYNWFIVLFSNMFLGFLCVDLRFPLYVLVGDFFSGHVPNVPQATPWSNLYGGYLSDKENIRKNHGNPTKAKEKIGKPKEQLTQWTNLKQNQLRQK